MLTQNQKFLYGLSGEVIFDETNENGTVRVGTGLTQISKPYSGVYSVKFIRIGNDMADGYDHRFDFSNGLKHLVNYPNTIVNTSALENLIGETINTAAGGENIKSILVQTRSLDGNQNYSMYFNMWNSIDAMDDTKNIYFQGDSVFLIHGSGLFNNGSIIQIGKSFVNSDEQNIEVTLTIQYDVTV